LKKLISALSAGLLLAGSSLTGQELFEVFKDNKNKLHIDSEVGKLILEPTVLDKSYRTYKFKSDNPDGSAVYIDHSGKDEATIKVSFDKKESNMMLVTYTFDFTNRKNTNARYARLRFPCSKWMGSKLVLDKKVIPVEEKQFKETYGYAKNIALIDNSQKKIISIYADNGLDFTVSDLRRWNDPKIELRIRLGKGKRELKFFMEILPGKSTAYEEVSPANVNDDSWKEFVLNWKSADTPVWNFSDSIPTPAGKFGFIKVDGPEFITSGNNNTIRFWGVNISAGSCFPSHEDAESIAKFLRRWGVNAVRFSHIDSEWARGLIDYKNKNLTFDDEKFDLFFYLIGELKKNGIYYIIDCKHDMVFKTAHFSSIKDYFWKRGGSSFLLTFSQDYNEHFNAYLNELFLRKNPYTGLALADDPALAGVQMINESFLNRYPEKVKTTKDIPELCRNDFVTKWEKWSSEHDLSGNYDENTNPIIRKRFISWLERTNFKRLYKFLRDDLRVKCPIASTSCYVGTITFPSAAEGDYSEGHSYYSHPRGQKISYNGKIERLSYLKLEPSYVGKNYDAMYPFLLQQRIGYQPFVVGEWNNCMSENFSAPLMMTTIGNIQGINGSFLFNLTQMSWSKIDTRNVGMFTSFGKPGIMINMIPAALAWHRNLIPEAKEFLAITVNDSEIFGGTAGSKIEDDDKIKKFGEAVDAQGKVVATKEPYNYNAFAENEFLFKVFNLPLVPGIKMPPSNVVKIHYSSYSGREYPKSKEQAKKACPVRHQNNQFTVSTPEMVAVWGIIDGTSEVGALKVVTESKQDFSVTAIALDQKPLAQSKRVLITIGTSSCSKKTIFLDKKDPKTNKTIRRFVYKQGRSESMFKVVDSTLSFAGSRWKCYKVSNIGVKQNQIASSNSGSISWKTGKDNDSLFFLLEK
jgi:hypothetical protein